MSKGERMCEFSRWKLPMVDALIFRKWRRHANLISSVGHAVGLLLEQPLQSHMHAHSRPFVDPETDTIGGNGHKLAFVSAGSGGTHYAAIRVTFCIRH